MVKMSIEKKSIHPLLPLALLLICGHQAILSAYTIYDTILYSRARDNQIVMELFFDLDFEDQVLIMKALAVREEPYFEDIADEIRQRYSQRDAYKYELLIRTLIETMLQRSDPGPIRERIAANAAFFDTMFINLEAVADPGCKREIIILLNYALKPEYVPVLLSESNRLLSKIRNDDLSAEHFLPEILALMEFAEEHRDKEFLYFGSQIIQKIKNKEAYAQIKKIIDKLL
jgi:hypothetical protein